MNDKIWSRREAKRWQEGYPLGNGRIGAMIYGGVAEEIIELSELTFFSGSPSKENDQPNAARAFSLMRKLTEEEKYDEAYAAAGEFIGVRHNYGTNLPVGKLLFRFLEQAQAEQYCRVLDLETGMFELNCRQSGTQIRRRAFVSHPDQLLCYEMTAEGAGTISGRLTFDGEENPYSTDADHNGYTFLVQARERVHSDGSSGVSLNGLVKAYAEGGTAVYKKEGIWLSGCKRIFFGVWMETDFNDTFKSSALDIGREYAALLKRHREDMAHKMNRVSFTLGETKDEVPTDERVEAVRRGEEDSSLSALQFQFGRYLLLCSSREDSPLPAHLQGVWNDHVACRIGWSCDMHLDINTQMNYWLSEPANLSECHAPLFRWMEEVLIPSGRISAKKSYGAAGWCADLVSNAWGYSAPYWSRTISPCPTGGIWQASDYMEHYRYTQDRAFLEEHAWPVIREAVEFFTEYVFEDSTGRISSGPSVSPENAFVKDGKTRYFSNGCTYELVMIRELFCQYREICRILQVEDRLLQKVTAYQDKLLAYRVKADKTLAEWQHDEPSADRWHRHTSHLLGLFPYAQITPEDTPRLADAARASIAQKTEPSGSWEDTGWARSMLLLYSARLLEHRKAYEHIRSMQRTLTHPNLLVMHPPTRGADSFMEVYELDGNTGFSMGVLELLLQSHNGVIRLLPCLPKQWKDGQISGIVARGGVEVSMCWKEGILTEAVLHCKKGGVFVIEYTPDGKVTKRRELVLQGDKKVRLSEDLEVE